MSDNEPLAAWQDQTSGIIAQAIGSPTFRQDAFGGRAAIRFDGASSFRVDQRTSPMSGIADFTIAIVFATSSPELVGTNGAWFQNTGLLDANSLGFAQDWGISINAAGRLATGMGGGFGQPAQTVYSSSDGWNDGELHVAVVARTGSHLAISVDGGTITDTDAASSVPRANEVDMSIGALSGGSLPLRGDIAEIQIFDGMLDEAEISALLDDVSRYYSNSRPVATADTYAVQEDEQLLISASDGVLSNDADADGDRLAATLLSTPTHGTIELLPDGSFVYEPSGDFAGSDTFLYAADDGIQLSLPTAVIINVAPVNDLPVAKSDVYYVAPNHELTVVSRDGLLANDLDVDNDALATILVEPPQHGSLELAEDGSFRYVPAPAYTGTDTFTYSASDGHHLSNPTQVSIVVDTLAALRQVVINEIHSAPDESARPLEFIELSNRGSASVDLSGWSISRGVSFTFPAGTNLSGGSLLTVAQDPVDFQTKFATIPLGPWQGRLDGDGETIELRAAGGELVDIVSYGQGFPWPTVGDAPGHSLQLIDSNLDNDLGGSWRGALPTPNQPNSVASQHVPPLLRQVNHSPLQPKSDDPVKITIKGTDADRVSQVVLQYQVVDAGHYVRLTDADYVSQWTSVAMNDAGVDGDITAFDDVFTVVLPGSLQQHRRLIRYRIIATDAIGDTVQVPYADDPSPNFAYFVYDGVPDWAGASQPGVTPVVTYTSDTMNSLPAYHLIANETDVTRSQYNSTYNNRHFLATLVYDGIVYDHIVFKNRGQNSTYVTGKNKWKLLFNSGHEFVAKDDYGQPW
ncbi:MAG: tandem-95 repeat protein, partial [Planctomycetales bacterium]|nr:tandem-95 repeat protein [Planctomycetales bacterium]